MRLTIQTAGPARVEVRGPGDQMYQPEGALLHRPGGRTGYAPGKSFYLGHFTSTGEASLDLPPARYTVIVEKGTEFERIETPVDLKEDQTLRLQPKRWINMSAKGWWSGDFHIHRPIEDAKTLLLAEDLNLGVFFTIWNTRNLWEGKEIPADPIIRAGATHVATVLNAEDERAGGAWMMHNLKQPFPLASGPRARYEPLGLVYVDQAKAQGAWFDSEKPIWWEVPVMAASTRIDSMGVLHNHYQQYGMLANEAWGRKRDQQLYPGNDGFSNYSLGLYYRYLNAGCRYPASAGSASGVLVSPPGYNRIYAYSPGGFSVDSFYSAVRSGRNFVTNGPMLFFTVNGKMPGDTVDVRPGRPLKVVVEAQSREPIDRVEVVANGRVVAQKSGGRLEVALDPKNHTWLIARAYLKPGITVRLAHTSPVYLAGAGQIWDASEDHEYFIKWIDDLIASCESDPKRFGSDDEKTKVLKFYKGARGRYNSTRLAAAR